MSLSKRLIGTRRGRQARVGRPAVPNGRLLGKIVLGFYPEVGVRTIGVRLTLQLSFFGIEKKNDESTFIPL